MDERIRALERAAKLDPAAAAALHQERVRLAGYDPRRDPTPGDVVLPAAHRIPNARTVEGEWDGRVPGLPPKGMRGPGLCAPYVLAAWWDDENAEWAPGKWIKLESWRAWAKGGTVVRFGAQEADRGR